MHYCALSHPVWSTAPESLCEDGSEFIVEFAGDEAEARFEHKLLFYMQIPDENWRPSPASATFIFVCWCKFDLVGAVDECQCFCLLFAGVYVCVHLGHHKRKKKARS